MHSPSSTTNPSHSSTSTHPEVRILSHPASIPAATIIYHVYPSQQDHADRRPDSQVPLHDHQAARSKVGMLPSSRTDTGIQRADNTRLTGTSSLRSSKSPTATPPECASHGSSNKWRARRLHHALRVRRRTVAKQRTKIIPKQDYRRSLFHLHHRGLGSSRNTSRLRLTIHTRVHTSRPIHICRGSPRWKTSHRLKDGNPWLQA